MLYECLGEEQKADDLFYKADIEIKTAVYKNDDKAAVKGMTDMLGFIVDMAIEGTRGTKKLCPELAKKEANWKDVQKIIYEMRNPATGLRYANEKYMFN